MIQRKQTIWLLLAAICIFLTMNFPTYSGAVAEGVMHTLKGTENSILVIVTSMVGVVSLIAIFLYKHTKLQVRIVLVALLVEFVLAFLYYREIAKLTNPVPSLYALLHLGVVVFLLLAILGIKSDDKLLKESNRLR
jgi:phosphoglycerol transferase MdoB-like AlkP superfamily enzyme